MDGSWHHVCWVMKGFITFGRASRACLLVGVDAGAFNETAQGLPVRHGGGDDSIKPPVWWITSCGHHHRGDDYRGRQSGKSSAVEDGCRTEVAETARTGLLVIVKCAIESSGVGNYGHQTLGGQK